MNNHQKHIYGLLMEAADKLRAIQVYMLGAGSGMLTRATETHINEAVRHTWSAARAMERLVPPKEESTDSTPKPQMAKLSS